jgi:tetratricopeptide (TPR) repeat protein
MTLEEIQSSIDASEEQVREKRFDQDQASLSRVVETLQQSDASSSPFSSQIILRLATVLRELGKGLRFHDSDAEVLFTQAQAVLDIGIARFSDAKLHNEQGNLHFDIEDYDSALESFFRVINDDPGADPDDRIYAFESACASLRKLGVGLLDEQEAQRFRHARELLSRGLAEYPNNGKLFNAEGRFYYDAQQFDRALESFKKTINDNSISVADRISAYENAGATLGELRRFNEAAEMFRQALAASRGTPSASLLIERGWLEFYQEMYDLAFTSFTEAYRQAVAAADEVGRHDAMVGQIASRQAVDAVDSAANDRARDLMKNWLNEGLSHERGAAVLAGCDLVYTDMNLYRAALLNDDLRLIEFNSNDPDALLAKITALKWLRRFSEAEKLCREVQEARPTDIRFWKELGNIYYQQKKYQKAYDYYTGEATKDPANAAQNNDGFLQSLKNDEEATEWTIVTLRKMRQLIKAKEKVNWALANFGERAGFLCEQGYIYFTERKFNEAIAVFDHSMQTNDYYAFAHQWRAASYRKMLQFDKAKEKINEALTKLPTDAGIWEERAWIAFDQNELSQADEYFATAIKLDPYISTMRYSRVEVLNRLNRSDDARKILLDLETEFKDDIEVAEQLGWFYLRRGELDHADTQFSFIERKDSKNPLGINGRGGYYLEQGEYVLAAKAFRQAIKEVGYEPQYHVNRAWALLRQVKPPGEIPESQLYRREELLEGARKECRAALDLDKFDAKVHICLGVIAFKSDSLSDAEGYFRKSIELGPAEGGHVELGALYTQMGRYSDAEKELAEAIKINSNDTRAHIEIANLRLLQDNLKEAVREARNAATVEPHNDEAQRALAIALMRAGQEEEAEKALRKALGVVRVSKRWPLHLALSQILIRLGDVKNKDVQDSKKKNTDFYGEALNQIYEALRTHPSPCADVFFHAGIAHFKLDDFRASRQNFDECLKADRNRFDAERYGKVVQAKIEQERKALRVSILGSGLLAGLSVAMLLFLWIAYASGFKRTVPIVEKESAESKVKDALKTAEEAKLAELNANNTAKVKESAVREASNAAATARAARPAQKATLDKVAETKAVEALKATQVATDAEKAKNEAIARVDASVKAAASPPKPQEEVVVDRQMLTVYTPMLLGLFVIALLLPNLSKLKLFGGIEAEISEVKAEISSGPKGDVGFGSSLPIISPGPR